MRLVGLRKRKAIRIEQRYKFSCIDQIRDFAEDLAVMRTPLAGD